MCDFPVMLLANLAPSANHPGMFRRQAESSSVINSPNAGKDIDRVPTNYK